MDYKLSKIQSDELFSKLKKDYLILAPKVFKGEGRYSDLDSIRYGEVSSFEEILCIYYTTFQVFFKYINPKRNQR